MSVFSPFCFLNGVSHLFTFSPFHLFISPILLLNGVSYFFTFSPFHPFHFSPFPFLFFPPFTHHDFSLCPITSIFVTYISTPFTV